MLLKLPNKLNTSKTSKMIAKIIQPRPRRGGGTRAGGIMTGGGVSGGNGGGDGGGAFSSIFWRKLAQGQATGKGD